MNKVIKRDGSLEDFNIQKIFNAVTNAYKANGKEPSPEVLSALATKLSIIKDNTKIEDIQNLIEQTLFEHKEADIFRAFVLYREAHNKSRKEAQKKWEYINRFVESANTADATIDDNSNVNNHNVAVLNAEIHKEDNMQTNMYIWEHFLKEKYSKYSPKQMRLDFATIFYPHDASSQVLMPYCQADTMYPFATGGLKALGGKSAIPKSLESYVGMYINLVFALASEVKGAVATPEFLMYFDHYARKEWGNDYYLKVDKLATGPECLHPRTINQQIYQYFQQTVYSINQVASSRGAQCPFTNFSFFDKYFFEGMFGEFVFPDGDRPCWESVNWLQQNFLHWFNEERLRCILTFPVCSYAVLVDEEGNFKDEATFEFITKEYAEGNSFFTYLSKSVDSLSSCCRLQNAVQENTFNFTNGQIGVMTGSKQVVTMNLSRIIQDFFQKKAKGDPTVNFKAIQTEEFHSYFVSIIDRVHTYLLAYNDLLHWAYDHKLFNAYSAGFINLNKQYLTVGICGLAQAAEYLGLICNDNEDYKKFCELIYTTISNENKAHRTKTAMFNTEQVPKRSGDSKPFLIDSKLLK